MSGHYVAVAKVDDIPKKGNRAFEVEGRDVLICRSSAGIYAVRNLCSHAQSKLEGGMVRGHFLFCPRHGVRFDLRDGSTSSKLTQKPILTFEIRVAGDMVEVKVG